MVVWRSTEPLRRPSYGTPRTRTGNLLNTLRILEQLVAEWTMAVEENQDHIVCGLDLEEADCFAADEADEWKKKQRMYS